MPRRILSLALATVVVAFGAGCADDVAPGIEVGSEKISVDDVLDEVAEWSGNQAASFYQEPGGSAPTSYPMEAVDALIQQRIELEVHRQQFEALGLKIDAEVRRKAIESLFQGDTTLAEQALGGFSDGYAASYLDDIARQISVQATLGEAGYAQWRTLALGSSHIEINPRFGSWNADSLTVSGPQGPIGRVQPSLQPAGP